METVYHLMDSSSSSSPKRVTTNWLELPPEVMSIIFTKVGAIDILLAVQFVCTQWRRLCKEPRLFRSISTSDDDGEYDESIANWPHKIVKIAEEAVNRSCGQLIDFSIDTFATDDILELIIAKNSPLRCLRITYCLYISDNAVIDMAKKLPLLEELELSYCEGFECPEEVVEAFGRSCPLLKSFTLNYWDHNDPLSSILDNRKALAIARSMPELLRLNLSGTNVTENCLQAIFDGCPHLKFLDLSRCTNLTFSWRLVKMWVDRNIELRLLDVASIDKLITGMVRQLLSLLKEYVKLIQEADLKAGYSGKEFEAFYKAIENLEVPDAVEDLESGYTANFFATSGSILVLPKVVLNELVKMQSMLSVLSHENVLLIAEAPQVEQYMEVVMAQLQDLKLRTLRMMETISSVVPCLHSRQRRLARRVAMIE